MSLRKHVVAAICFAALPALACTIGVKPVDPIVVNLNVKVEQELRVTLDREIEELMGVEQRDALVSTRSADASDASRLRAAREAGLVGERPDGQLGLVGPTDDPALAVLVERENERRLASYEAIATRSTTSREIVQVVAGRKRIDEARPGERVLTSAGDWVAVAE